MNSKNVYPTPQEASVNDPLIGDFYRDVLELLPYEPNEEQVEAFAAFAHFLLYGAERSVFLLNGYAGTGKTSLMGAVVQALSRRNTKVVLLAPTGRAAQVLSEYSHRGAFTIHRKIYRQESYLSEGFGLAENKHTSTVFIVDEASMIANGTAEGAIFGTGRLLDDLVHYVYSGTGCKLMLMGDGAQLPPVGQSQSPALNREVLRGYGLTVYDVTLRQIARQASDSGILLNATLVRHILTSNQLVTPKLELQQYNDIDSITGEFLLETLSDCYDRDVWARDYDNIDFIANGDVMRVKRVWGEVEQMYGLRFANVTVELPDHGNVEMDVKIVINSLQSDTPALTLAQSERLYNDVLNELSGTKRERYQLMKQHPYFNALQVKFAYALTCHKAQGGQWKNVFIDMGSIMPEALSTIDFLRWLYTAITRARERVYLINCPISLQEARLESV